MGFAVSAESYDRFMGRFSEPLAAVFADLAGVPAGAHRRPRVLDVGCGPGALTAELLRRGADVAAVDPSPPFVAAARARHPGVEVLEAAAEALPFADAAFDAALAQLVVHFMRDPVQGVREMVRVTRPGGPVACCVWDHATGPLGVFWEAVASLHIADGPPPSEAARPGSREGDLARILADADIARAREVPIAVTVAFASFDDWWAPFELGVGPAGDHVAGLDRAARQHLAARCRALLPAAPFEVRAVAWAAVGMR
ncbi:class I SAM-dependent methyltransferase [Agrococcus sp. BE272]|uniref:class I SAM-dependent methyltransferase n=1 Tax=Agrococcus sp. BE272 TaxID=2817727 RepID=UPI0028558256|nr:class I SAM-dependent methyltransferase [Agrococcus sp. BE272]MDR7234262.1 SAM-dependent methyltransferase [Agrococcus sp. BE272]